MFQYNMSNTEIDYKTQKTNGFNNTVSAELKTNQICHQYFVILSVTYFLWTEHLSFLLYSYPNVGFCLPHGTFLTYSF